MTGLDLDRRGFHSIGHETFQRGRDRPVFRGNGVPARLRPPRRFRRLPRKQGVRDPSLHGVENARRGGVYIASEVPEERFLAQLRKAARFDETCAGRWQPDTWRGQS